jgi:ribosomal protein S18 acetylase RimI-like enzyme
MTMEIPGRSEQLTPPELREKGLTLYNSWSGTLANDLVVASRQPHIIDEKATPRDASHRFPDWESAMDWYEKGQRSVYSLRDEQNQLAGIIWYDVRPRPDLGATHTFAIRLYDQAVGKGVGPFFIEAAQKDFETKEDNPVIWLETSVENVRAIRLYVKSGYRIFHEEAGRVTMIYDPRMQTSESLSD